MEILNGNLAKDIIFVCKANNIYNIISCVKTTNGIFVPVIVINELNNINLGNQLNNKISENNIIDGNCFYYYFFKNNNNNKD